MDETNIFYLLRKNEKEKIKKILGTSIIKYDNLINQLKIFQMNNKNITLENILLNNDTDISYKKKLSICEFPTYELISFIFIISKHLHISEYEELFSGIGCLSKSIKNYNITSDYKFKSIQSIDANYSYNTDGYKYDDNIIKKDILEYIIDYNDFSTQKKEIYQNDTLFLIAWPDISYIFIIKKFLETIKPKCLILILPYKYNQSQVHDEYKLEYLHLKQLCYRDNKYNYINNNSHSLINIFYKKEIDINFDTIDKNMFLNEYKYSNINILKDLCETDNYPNDFFKDFINNEMISKLLVDKLIKFKIKKLPSFIDNILDFNNYINLCDKLKTKIKFKNNNKFKICMNLYNIYDNCTFEEYKKAQEEGIIPNWVNQYDIVKYIIDEYTEVDKNIIYEKYS